MKKSLLTVFLVIITCVMLGAKPDTTFLDFAEKLADNQKNIQNQVNVLCSIAYESYLSGDRSKCDALLTKALNKSNEEKNIESKNYELLFISTIMAKIDDNDKALKISKSLPKDNLAPLYCELAINMAKKGNVDETIKMIKNIKDFFFTQKAVFESKLIFIEKKEYNSAISFIEKLTNDEQRFYPMLDVFILMAKDKKPDTMEPLIKKHFKLQQDRNVVYEQIILNLGYDNIEVIKRYAEMYEDQDLKNGYLSVVSMLYGSYETAVKYCNLINDDLTKTFFLSKIGVILLIQNNYNLGMKIIDEIIAKSDFINNNHLKDQILSTMAVNLISSNYPEKAIEATEKISDYQEVDSLLTEIATETAKKSNFEVALSAAEKVFSTIPQIRAFSGVASQMANNNKIEESIKLFDKSINLFYADSETREDRIVFEIIAAEISKIKNLDTAIKISKLFTNEEDIAIINNIVSMIMIKNGRYDEAYKLFKDRNSILTKTEYDLIDETIQFLTKNKQFIKAIEFISTQKDPILRFHYLLLMHQTNLITKYDINADVKTALKKVIY